MTEGDTRTGAAEAGGEAQPLLYEPNPKHKEPWQRGARGSLCPPDVDATALLATSETDPRHPGKRYATDGRRAYCGHEHALGRWHGFPSSGGRFRRESATHGWQPDVSASGL
jgi:hypothetical protein